MGARWGGGGGGGVNVGEHWLLCTCDNWADARVERANCLGTMSLGDALFDVMTPHFNASAFLGSENYRVGIVVIVATFGEHSLFDLFL